MTAVGGLRVFVGVAAILAFGCGAGMLGGTPSSDASSSSDASDAPELPYIEVDCTPTIPEIGRFFPQCHLSEIHFANTTAAVPLVSCERINDAGGWTGTVNVFVNRPDAITIGQPVMVGGADPLVTIVAISGSVIMELVQTIPDSDAGAVVFDVLDPGLEPGRSIRGRFIDVTFSRYPRPPTYPCRISNSEFVALH